MKLFTRIILLVLFSGTLLAQDAPEELIETINKHNSHTGQVMVEGGEPNTDVYAQDAYSLPDYGPMIKGLDEIKEYSDEQQEMPQQFNAFKLETVDLFGDGDLWVEVGTYSFSMDIPQMEEPWSDNGKYVTVWQKVDGDWKVKLETWNSDNNPWQMMQKQMKGKEMHHEKHQKVDKNKDVK